MHQRMIQDGVVEDLQCNLAGSHLAFLSHDLFIFRIYFPAWRRLNCLRATNNRFCNLSTTLERLAPVLLTKPGFRNGGGLWRERVAVSSADSTCRSHGLDASNAYINSLLFLRRNRRNCPQRPAKVDKYKDTSNNGSKAVSQSFI